jgi:hypothetical protein
MSPASGRRPAPAEGSLVRVRGQRWIVGGVEAGAEAFVELNSIEDGRMVSR